VSIAHGCDILEVKKLCYSALLVDANKKKMKHILFIRLIKAFRLFEEETKNCVSSKVERKNIFFIGV
jgi:hypothetical protein